MQWITLFFFSSRRRHTRWTGDWSSDVCSSDLSGLPTMVPVTNNDLKIGRYQVFSKGYFAGLIDEVSIYNRALVPNEIASIRSEERRVGKECRSGWEPCQYRTKCDIGV